MEDEAIEDPSREPRDAQEARAFVKKFLVKKEGTVLRAWMQRLDPEWERSVTEQRFMRYMRDIRCPKEHTCTQSKIYRIRKKRERCVYNIQVI